MITSKFNTETGILETVMSGEVTVQEFLEYTKGLSTNKSLPSKLKILSDAKKAKIFKTVKPEDMLKIAEFNKELITKGLFVYDAIIVSGTFETALGQLYKDYSAKPNYFVEIFSSKKAAENWLRKF